MLCVVSYSGSIPGSVFMSPHVSLDNVRSMLAWLSHMDDVIIK